MKKLMPIAVLAALAAGVTSATAWDRQATDDAMDYEINQKAAAHGSGAYASVPGRTHGYRAIAHGSKHFGGARASVSTEHFGGARASVPGPTAPSYPPGGVTYGAEINPFPTGHGGTSNSADFQLIH